MIPRQLRALSADEAALVEQLARLKAKKKKSRAEDAAGGGVAAPPPPAPAPDAQGAGAGVPREWTAEQVAQEVCGLGKSFEQYRDAIIDNGLDGGTLLDATDGDLKECGISINIHIQKIRKKLAGT